MSKPSLGKISLAKIANEHLFQGRNGDVLDLVIWENRDGPDQYGNTHYICQGVSKEARERKERGPIIGNIKMVSEVTEREQGPPPSSGRRPPGPLHPSAPPSRPRPPADPDLDPSSDVPF